MLTLERVKRLLIDKFHMNIDELTPQTTLEHLGLDPINRIEFMFDIENEFDIRMTDEDFRVTTIQDVADVVDSFILEQRIRFLNEVMISNN